LPSKFKESNLNSTMKVISYIVLLCLTLGLASCLLAWDGPDLTTQLAKAYYVSYTIIYPDSSKQSFNDLPPTSFVRIKRKGDMDINISIQIKDTPSPLYGGFDAKVRSDAVSQDTLKKYNLRDQYVVSSGLIEKLGVLYLHNDGKVIANISYYSSDGSMINLTLHE